MLVWEPETVVAERIKILIVEDEPSLSTTLVRATETYFSPLCVGSKAAAMGVVEDGTEVAAAIVDVGLPDGDGLEVVARLRARFADLPILVLNSFGPLSGNIPHRIKLDGFYSFDLRAAGRLTLGSSFRYQSGIPINVRSGNRFMLPRGAGGRVQPNYQWNISLGYAYPLPRDVEIEFNARVLNVTNAKAVLRVDDNYGGGNPIPGGDLSDLKHAGQRTKARPNDNFGVPIQFQQPISAQFELKVRF